MLLVVDTCIWVSAFVPSEQHHISSRKLVDNVLTGHHQVILPYVVLTEVVCRIALRLKGNSQASEIAVRWGEQVLRMRNIYWKPIDRLFAYEAALFGQKHGLRGMDALIAFAALHNNCELLTEDEDFQAVANIIKVKALSDVLR